MDGEYPCSRTQSPMNRTIFRCRAVSVGSSSGPPDAWFAVVLLMSPLRRAGPSPDDVMLHVNAKKQNPVLEIFSARTHLLSVRSDCQAGRPVSMTRNRLPPGVREPGSADTGRYPVAAPPAPPGSVHSMCQFGADDVRGHQAGLDWVQPEGFEH